MNKKISVLMAAATTVSSLGMVGQVMSHAEQNDDKFNNFKDELSGYKEFDEKQNLELDDGKKLLYGIKINNNSVVITLKNESNDYATFDKESWESFLGFIYNKGKAFFDDESSQKNKFIIFNFAGKIQLPEDSSFMFAGYSNMGNEPQEIRQELKKDFRKMLSISLFTGDLNTDGIKNASYMFYLDRYFGLNGYNFNVNKWNVSNITNMKYMFAKTNVSANFSDWNTSKVTDMEGMFMNIYSEKTPNVSKFNTSNVTNMKDMFMGSYKINPDVSNWNTDSLEDSSRMFAYTNEANPDLSKWNVSKLKKASSMFNEANGIKKLDLQKFKGIKQNSNEIFLKTNNPVEYIFVNGELLKNNSFILDSSKYGLYKGVDLSTYDLVNEKALFMGDKLNDIKNIIDGLNSNDLFTIKPYLANINKENNSEGKENNSEGKENNSEGQVSRKNSSSSSASYNNDKNKDSKLNFDIERIYGINRVETSIKVAKKFRNSDTVLLATADSYPDSLSASPLAASFKAPILLTYKDNISKDTLDVIKELGAKKIIIVGQTNSISKKVEDILKEKYDVERIGGRDRYETSALIAERFSKLNNNSGALICSGEVYPDALSAAPLANKLREPILLVKHNSTPLVIKDKIDNLKIKRLTVIGGDRTVEAKDLKYNERIYGIDRYQTSLKIAKMLDSKISYLTTGENYADAIVTGPIASLTNSPILLSKVNTIDQNILNYLNKNAQKVVIVGGFNSVSGSIFNK